MTFIKFNLKLYHLSSSRLFNNDFGVLNILFNLNYKK